MPAPDTIAASDVLNASKGMLQKQLYAIFTEPTSSMGPVLEMLEKHLDFQVDLDRRGIWSPPARFGPTMRQAGPARAW